MDPVDEFAMSIDAMWDVFVKFVWPLALAYAAYLHKQLAAVMQKFDDLRDEHYRHVAQVNKDFATREVVSQLENKLTIVLNRIDDKVTRILEERK